VTSLPAYASSSELERLLGDPFDRENPLSVDYVVDHDEREATPDLGVAKLREFRFQDYLIPVGLGGKLRSFEETISLARVVCRRDMVMVMGFGSTMVAALPVWMWGNDTQRRALAELMGRGAFGAMAFSEDRAGNDVLATETVARPVPGGFILSGEKWLIGNATRGEFLSVLARSERHLSFYFVRKQDLDPGTFRHLPKIKTLGLRGHDLSGIAFQDCPIREDAILDTQGRGVEIMLRTIQVTKTLTAGMSLGLMDSALRIALGYAHDRRLYGSPIAELAPIRELLIGAFLDALVCDCITTSTARALTFAPDRASLWSAVTKYYVPSACERIVRDLSVVLSARFYLRERVAGGLFQKIARDLAITSIFEGTTLLQLALISAQLEAVTRPRGAGRPGRDAAVDLRALFSLDQPAPAFRHEEPRLKISNDGQDEIVQRFATSARAFQNAYSTAAGDRSVFESIAALLQQLVEQGKQLVEAVERSPIADRSAPPSAERFALARMHCHLHAAAACLHSWIYNRELLGGEFADGRWLAMCLARILGELTGPRAAHGQAPYGEDVFRWMMRHLDDGLMFSMTGLPLAR
jgi:alkylation response protein AidB-like acyl-CoA dehydrogenase